MSDNIPDRNSIYAASKATADVLRAAKVEQRRQLKAQKEADLEAFVAAKKEALLAALTSAVARGDFRAKVYEAYLGAELNQYDNTRSFTFDDIMDVAVSFGDMLRKKGYAVTYQKYRKGARAHPGVVLTAFWK